MSATFSEIFTLVIFLLSLAIFLFFHFLPSGMRTEDIMRWLGPSTLEGFTPSSPQEAVAILFAAQVADDLGRKVDFCQLPASFQVSLPLYTFRISSLLKRDVCLLVGPIIIVLVEDSSQYKIWRRLGECSIDDVVEFIRELG